jgi:hypothetical protein
MGFFKKLFHKGEQRSKDVNASQGELLNGSMAGHVKPGSKIGFIGFIKENCELVQDSRRQIEEAKAEYQAVTSYLTDIQKIEIMPKELRMNMEEAARRIISLSRERQKVRNISSSISDIQFRLFERFEAQIPKDLVNLKDSENYRLLIQKDIEQLEKEKTALNDEEAEIISKQSFLKGIGIATGLIVITMFILFSVLSGKTEADFSIPFLLTVLMGMASAIYIFMEARKNSQGLKLVGLKQKRQVMLMNKVKLKLVNNRSFLEYVCSKYMVDDYEHLKSAWEEYVRVKDEIKRYKSNTKLLEFYNSELIQELQKAGIADSEVWIYQPTAILDSREMVEIRHRLNVRRQSLRDRIDSGIKQMDEAIKSITEAIKAYPELEDEIMPILRRHGIEK